MNQNELIKKIDVNNEFDYSNIVVDIQTLSYLVQYCESVYNQFQNLIIEDEQKNEKLKYEFKNYQYKKYYATKFDILVKKKDTNYSSINCKSYESFVDAINNNHLNNVDSLTITLNLSYRRGKETELVDYENEFKFIFKPWDIKFYRKSNYSEEVMNQIENNLNNILKKFKIQNSIFCTK